jgi:hypothetical protein
LAVALAAAVLLGTGSMSGCGGGSAAALAGGRPQTTTAGTDNGVVVPAPTTSTNTSGFVAAPPVQAAVAKRSVGVTGPVLGVNGSAVFAAVTGDSLNLDRVRDGRVLRRLMAAHAGRSRIVAIGVVKPGVLAIVWSTAPRCSNDRAYCEPVPHTCWGRVETLQLATGRTAVLLRTGPDTQIGTAQLSPDGTQLAAVVASCATVPPVTHLVVKRLPDGKSWTMGTADNYCQFPGAPAWSADGTHLLVPFSSATPALSGGQPTDACEDPQVYTLLSVPAHRTQPGLHGVPLPAAAGCYFGAVAAAGSRLYAVQICPLHQTRADASSLVRITSAGAAVQRWRLGPCSFATPAVTADGRVLVSGGQDCRATRTSSAATPGTFLDLITATKLTRIVKRTGFTTGYDLIAW